MTNSEKLDLLLDKVGAIETRLGTIETRLDTVETKIVAIETRLDAVETEIATMKTRLDAVETRLGTVEADVKCIKLTMENEIRVNIQRVAEGHLDLSRNLHEAIKSDSEKEMLSVRVSILETEMQKTKQKLENIA